MLPVHAHLPPILPSLYTQAEAHWEHQHLFACGLLPAVGTCLATVGKDALSLVINRSLCLDSPSICAWRIIPRPVELSFSHLQLSMTQLFIDSLPLLISLLHSLPIFFGIASQINHLHSNPSILEDSGQWTPCLRRSVAYAWVFLEYFSLDLPYWWDREDPIWGPSAPLV